MSYTNSDGLYVLTFKDIGEVQDKGTTIDSIRRALVIDLADFTTIGATFGASDIDPNDPIIPANSVITNAYLKMTTAATSGGAATLTIGTYNAAGTAVDADGIDAAVALTVIDAVGDVVQCNGAQVGGLVTTGTVDTYVGLNYGTAAYTAGAGKLVIEYITV